MAEETLRDELEQIFAEASGLPVKRHKNVLGSKWKLIDPLVPFVQAKIEEAKRQERNRLFQELDKVKPLGEDEMRKVIQINKALLDTPRLAPKLLFCVAQAAHQNVIDQLKERLGG